MKGGGAVVLVGCRDGQGEEELGFEKMGGVVMHRGGDGCCWTSNGRHRRH
jgi:hypothetical protein